MYHCQCSIKPLIILPNQNDYQLFLNKELPFKPTQPIILISAVKMAEISVNLDIDEKIKSKLIDLGDQKPQREQKIANELFSRQELEILLQATQRLEFEQSKAMSKNRLQKKLKGLLTGF